MIKSLSILFIAIIFSQKALSGETIKCWPTFTSADATFQFEKEIEIDLYTQNISERYLAPVKVDLMKNDNQLLVKIRSTAEVDEYHLPFNVYAYLVVKDGVPIIYNDLTEDCTRAGESVFPGQSYTLSQVLLKPNPKSEYKVVVWGQ